MRLVMGFMLTSFFWCTNSQADTPPEPNDINLEEFLPSAAMEAVTKTFGNITGHRPYEGATGLGPGGINLGLEVTLVHLPDDFTSAISGAEMSDSSTSELPAIPTFKLHLHKGLGPILDIGCSGLYLPGNYMIGGDAKLVISQPEEGPTWAMRFTYSGTQLDLDKLQIPPLTVKYNGTAYGTATMVIKSRHLTLQLLASKKMDFAEPWIGIGAERTNGHIEVPIKLDNWSKTETFSTPTYESYALFAFTGLSLKIPQTGLRIALEGAYHTRGMHTLGLILGVGF
jgi:hypothetical protein